MRSRTAVALTGPLALFLIAACSAPDPTAGRSHAPVVITTPPSATGSGPPVPKAGRACQVVTGAEAAKALGVPGSLKPRTDTIGQCEYQAANGNDSVEVSLEHEEYAEDVVATMLRMLDTTATKSVSGLGDAAFLYTVDPSQTQYHVWAHGRYLVLIVTRTSTGTPPTATAQAAATLAHAAVPRL